MESTARSGIGFWTVIIWALEITLSSQLGDVQLLTAEPDFRSMSLRWEYPKTEHVHGFEVHYCELQAWGPNRCKTKTVDGLYGRKRRGEHYTTVIGGLRMSTNYSFEVRPFQLKHSDESKARGQSIVAPTKGFSAKASTCLPHMSEVEVSTGPFFGGRIAVEAGGTHAGTQAVDSPACWLSGNANSSQETYVLHIDHNLCGSVVNRTSVSTYILVQENLPILTHSTRRFLVLCTFQPETLTVRAGINLPHHRDRKQSTTTKPPVESDISLNEIASGNEILPASLTKFDETRSREGRARKFSQGKEKERIGSKILLLGAGLCVCCLAGVVAWCHVPNLASNNAKGLPINCSDSASTISSYESYTNSFKDNVSIAEVDFSDILEVTESIDDPIENMINDAPDPTSLGF